MGKNLTKFIFRFIVYSCILFLLIAVLLSQLLSTEQGVQRAFRFSQHMLKHRFNIELTAKSVKGDWFSDISLDQVVIIDPDNFTLKVDHFSLNYIFPFFIFRGLFLKQLVVSNAELEVHGTQPFFFTNKDSALPIISFAHSDKLGLYFQNIDIDSLKLIVKKFKGDEIHQFEGIKLSTHLSFHKKLDVTVEQFTYMGGKKWKKPVHITGNLKYNFFNKNTEITGIYLKSDTTNVKIMGAIQQGGTETSLKLFGEVNRFNLAEIEHLTPGLTLQNRIMDGKFQLKGTLDALMLSFNLQDDHTQFFGKSLIDFNPTGLPNISLSLDFQSLDPNLFSKYKILSHSLDFTLPSLASHPVHKAFSGLKQLVNEPLQGQSHIFYTPNTRESHPVKIKLTLLDPSRLGDKKVVIKTNLALNNDDIVVESGTFTSNLGEFYFQGLISGWQGNDQFQAMEISCQIPDVNLKDLKLNYDVYGKIDLHTDIKTKMIDPFKNNSSEGRIVLTAKPSDPVKPITYKNIRVDQIDLNLSWIGEEIAVDHACILTADDDFNFEGFFHPPTQTFQIKGMADIMDVGKYKGLLPIIYQNMPEKLKLLGQARIDFNFNSSDTTPHLKMNLVADDLVLDQIFVKKMTASLDGPCRFDFSSPQILVKDYNFVIKSDMYDLNYSDQSITRIKINTLLDPSDTIFSLGMVGNPFGDISVKGMIENWTAAQKKLYFDTLSIQFSDYIINNKKPLRMTYEKGKLEIIKNVFTENDSEIAIDGCVFYDGYAKSEADLNIDLSKVPSNQIKWLIPDMVNLSGDIRAKININGQLDHPTITTYLSLNEGKIKDFKFSNMVSTLIYKDSIVHIDSIMQRNAQETVAVSGQLGIFLSLFPYEYQVQHDGLDLFLHSKNSRFTDIFNWDMAGIDFDAQFNMDAHLKGNFKNPQIIGEIQFYNGNLKTRYSSLRGSDIEGQMKLTNDKIIIENVKAKGRQGCVVNVTGIVSLSEWSPEDFDLKIDGKDLCISFKDLYSAKCNPQLALKGNLHDPKLTGEVVFTEARLNVDNLKDQEMVEIQLVYDSDNQDEIPFETEKIDWIHLLSADINLVMDQNAWIKGKKENIKMAGKIKLKKDPYGNFKLFGSLDAERGTYSFQGKLLKIDDGQLTFVGLDEINPDIIMNASTNVGEKEIYVNISGTFGDIHLEFDSNPKMDEPDIISYLLFGRSANDLKIQDEFNAQQMALNITSQLAVNQLNSLIGDTFKIDTFHIEPDKEDLQKSSVSVGKYIAPHIFVTYRHSFKQEEANHVEISYEFDEHFSLETQVGDEKSNGVDLVWEYDF